MYATYLCQYFFPNSILFIPWYDNKMYTTVQIIVEKWRIYIIFLFGCSALLFVQLIKCLKWCIYIHMHSRHSNSGIGYQVINFYLSAQYMLILYIFVMCILHSIYHQIYYRQQIINNCFRISFEQNIPARLIRTRNRQWYTYSTCHMCSINEFAGGFLECQQNE